MKTAKLKKGHLYYTLLFRYGILGVILIYISFVGFMHQQNQVVFPSADALCPFGGLESLYSILFQGKFIHRVLLSSLVLLSIITAITLFSGRSFCGWLCPLGTIQGTVKGVREKMVPKQASRFSVKDKPLRWLPYFTLAFFTVGAWYGGKMIIRPYDPWVAWMHLSEFNHALDDFFWGMLLLGLILVGSAFVPRIFCRYLCPMGGFLSLISRFSIAKISRDDNHCTHCGLCDKACPMGISVSQSTVANPSECIFCVECLNACPKKETLSITTSTRRKLSPIFLGPVIVGVFFGVITLAKAAGVYSSTPPSIAEYKAGGEFKPEMIKGYMSLREVAYLFDLPLEAIYAQLNLDSRLVPADTKCKDIAAMIDQHFDTDIVRVGVGALLEIPESDIATSCAPKDSNAPGFIYGTMTLEQVAQENRIPILKLYQRLNLDPAQIPVTTQCRELKSLVDPGFHTSRVRDAVHQIMTNSR